MSPHEKAALTAQASRDLRSLAFAGLRQRLPEANEHELGIRFAVLAYGKELVERVMGITVPDEDTRIPENAPPPFEDTQADGPPS